MLWILSYFSNSIRSSILRYSNISRRKKKKIVSPLVYLDSFHRKDEDEGFRGSEYRRRYLRGIPSNGTDVDHAIPEFDKSSPHDWDIQLGDILQDELDQLLVLLLAHPADKALTGQLLSILVRRQTVLGEYVVPVFLDKVGRRVVLKLFANLFEVRASDNTNDALLAKLLEKSTELGRDRLTSKGQGAIDVEEAECARVDAIRVCGGGHLEQDSWRKG